MRYLFVGLGNIGDEYKNTRHNAGFMCADRIAADYSFSSFRTKFGADLGEGNIGERQVIIAKPRTYMNCSGVAVSRIKNFYKIFLENVFVFHDDIDLKFCQIKCKIGGCNAGHRGLDSVCAAVGRNFHRIRIGIGRPEFTGDVSNFVLGKFDGGELERLGDLIGKISSGAETLFKNCGN
jgi:PTH1 family peptidyl-tRNA hydrolase